MGPARAHGAGGHGALDRLPGARGRHPNRVPAPVEEAILAHALEHPTRGAQRVADERTPRGILVSSGGVRGVWMRNYLQTRHHRLLRLEETVQKRKIKLSEEQIQALERFDPEYRERHIEVNATGELVAVDTFFAGTLKGVGKVYIQTVLDCFSRFVWARLYTSKMPVTAVQVLNNHALPFFEKHAVKVQTILSDNGREYCGRPDKHPYELFLQLEEIEHRTTKVGRPQSNGFIERFHRTLLEEHLRIKGRRPGTRRSPRCRRTWTAILRPTTPADPTVAAAWRAGRPTRSSRPGSRGSGVPGSPQPEGGQDRCVELNLGEAECQVITVLVHPANPHMPDDRRLVMPSVPSRAPRVEVPASTLIVSLHPGSKVSMRRRHRLAHGRRPTACGRPRLLRRSHPGDNRAAKRHPVCCMRFGVHSVL